jgi:hypothetical protein
MQADRGHGRSPQPKQLPPSATFASGMRIHHLRHPHHAKQGRDGMSLLESTSDSDFNPLGVVEDVAALNEWSFERSSEDEITILVNGQWTDYQISFTWMPDLEALHLACTFDMKIPEARKAEVQRLTARINEQLWIGHFDLWPQTGLVMFREALILPGNLGATAMQCERMLTSALDAAERYFPAFQFVVWAGKSAGEAMDAAMFDTAGEA